MITKVEVRLGNDTVEMMPSGDQGLNFLLLHFLETKKQIFCVFLIQNGSRGFLIFTDNIGEPHTVGGKDAGKAMDEDRSDSKFPR